jgi:hypothetical protein
MWILLALGVFFAAMGGLVLSVGVRERQRADSLADNGVLTQGVVTGFRKVPDPAGGEGDADCPVLRFQAADGRWVETVIGRGLGLRRVGPRDVAVGQAGPLIYDARDPRNAVLGTVIDGRAGRRAAMHCSTGVTFLVAGLVVLAAGVAAAA